MFRSSTYVEYVDQKMFAIIVKIVGGDRFGTGVPSYPHAHVDLPGALHFTASEVSADEITADC